MKFRYRIVFLHDNYNFFLNRFLYALICAFIIGHSGKYLRDFKGGSMYGVIVE